MKFHHIGVACKNIDEEIVNISKIHTIVKQSPKVFDEQQNAELVLLTLADGTNIELISGKQVETFLKKNITYYHICFEVDDINTEIERLVNENAFVISPPKPALLFQNRLVAFLNVSYGMIELLNSK
ncbi:VOC family protein [Mucilaginibacter sp. OK098]|uniref:VOC family protein n=1 Tax=Mucilaginibacter sp. OK098 TaxID=1855297 RepID=UPI000922D8BB|nr:VOC family protein [Mucilaginibacter sp. OK098]SHN33193.1 methylmalonyl-CoA/ethylmalonyl-CoA epimerase [Mucilaginibacter sp. OK098]